jgi:uncharacterized membrane protein HdeD (DUF308 family)
MSASMFALGQPELDDAARSVAKRWAWFFAAGIAITVLGILLISNIYDAARTLAVLVGLALLVQAIDEFVNASRYSPKWAGYALGAVYLVTGVLALAWPDITLWALAVVVGVGSLISGVGELIFVIRNHHDLPNRWVFVLLGLASVAIGIMALAWPRATVAVLALLLGIRVLIAGIVLIIFSLGLRRIAKY